MQKSKMTPTPTDKTSNMFILSKNNYQNLLRNAITTTYKKADENIGPKINKEGIKFAKQADTLDKIEVNDTDNPFVALKDHKKNFMSHPTITFINPSRKKIGKISKQVTN